MSENVFYAVFEALEADRKAGNLKRKLNLGEHFAVSKSYPGKICKFNSASKLLAVGYLMKIRSEMERAFYICQKNLFSR